MDLWVQHQFEVPILTYIDDLDGLPASIVTALAIDGQGSLWMGTYGNGVIRFDGHAWQQYQPLTKKKNPGPDGKQVCEQRLNKWEWSHLVNTMVTDMTGAVWIGTEFGLLRTEEDRLVLQDVENIPDRVITSLMVDSYGIVWVGTDLGVGRYDAAARKWLPQFIHGEDSYLDRTRDTYGKLTKGRVFAMVQDRRKTVWIATAGGLCRCKWESDVSPVDNYGVMWMDPLSELPGLEFVVSEIRKIEANLERDIVWFGSVREGIVEHRLEAPSKWRKVTLNDADPKDGSDATDAKIRMMICDADGILWVGTRGDGIRVYDSTQKTTYEVGIEHGLASEEVWSATLDKNKGTLWIGTTRGLNQYRARSVSVYNTVNTVASVDDTEQDTTGLAYNEVWKVAIDPRDKSLWFGTSNGLSRYKPGITPSWSKFAPPENNADEILSLVAIPKGGLNSLLPDNKASVLVGTLTGISYFDKEWKSLELSEDSGVKNGATSAMAVCKNGDFWVGTEFNGFAVRPPGEHESWSRFNQNEVTAVSDTVYDIFEDSDGDIWIASPAGVTLINGSSRKFEQVLATDNCTLVSNVIWSIGEDSESGMWFGSQGHGVSNYNKTTRLFKSYTVEQGLGGNLVYDICLDTDNNLWLATSGGLSLFCPEFDVFQNFTDRDGLPAACVYSLVEHGDFNERSLWLCTSNGVARFRPSVWHNSKVGIKKQAPRSKIVIDEITHGRAKVDIQSGTDHPILPISTADHLKLSVHGTGIDSFPRKLKMRYFWSKRGASKHGKWTTIFSGDLILPLEKVGVYTLGLQVIDRDIVSSDIKELKFSIVE